MAAYTTPDIRNIALVGTSGAGKTLLVEALAAAAGAIPHKGEIARGTTLSDCLPQERRSGHSLASKVVSLDCDGVHLNIIDTPGASDLIGRALAVLPAVETVAVVIDARSGPDLVARRMMNWAAARGLDRLLIVNRIDEAPQGLAAILARLQTEFGAHCLPLNLPARGGTGVVDCFFEPRELATDFGSVASAHTAMVEQVVELDDTLMRLYLEQGESLTPTQLHDPFEAALRRNHLVPVCFTSAANDAGIRELLAVCCRLLPNPTEGNPPDFFRGTEQTEPALHFAPDPARHVLAHAFKLSIDPFVGRIAMVRVHQGCIRPGTQLFIGDARRPFTVGHLLALQGARSWPVDMAIPGDICAIPKIDGIDFDAVLHDSHDEDGIHIRAIDLPSPMHVVTLSTRSRSEDQKLSEALAKLVTEDPSAAVEYHHASNETVLKAVGELHLRTLLADLDERFHVQVALGTPKIEYRETIESAAEGHARHKKQSGGAGQFGEVYLRVRPLARGAGIEFVDAVVGGAIPRQFLPAVEKGVRQALATGVIAGFPVQDIEVTVYDGRHHVVDSKEVAFVAAGRKACIDALTRAAPIVLEPVAALTVSTPSARVGDVSGDLATRRGRINETTMEDAQTSVINAHVPLAELNGYASHLKGLTAGAGSYEMTFSHYEPAPARVQQALRASYRPAQNGD